MTDLNAALTIDWQKEYQSLFIKVDQNLTRAIEAEKKLAIAKELLAEQEIQIASFKKFAQAYREAVRLAREKSLDANNILDKINWSHYL